MFEAWEFRPRDLDMEACLRRGIPIVGVNERHPSVDVFSFLGPLCVKQLHDCGLSVYKNRIGALCDNDFVGFSSAPVSRSSGASVDTFDNVASCVSRRVGRNPSSRCDRPLSLVSVRRKQRTSLLARPRRWRYRAVLGRYGSNCIISKLDWPFGQQRPPALGHMGILLSEIGPEPIVRLQAGGLRAAEWVRRSKPFRLADSRNSLLGRRSSSRQFTLGLCLDELDECARRGGEKRYTTHVERDRGRG